MKETKFPMVSSFSMEEGFPSENILSVYIAILSMALNDILLANQNLLHNFDSNAFWNDNGKTMYYFRIACSHLREVAVFIDAYHKNFEVKTFVGSLPSSSLQDARTLEKAFAKDGFVHTNLRPVRQYSFHYPKIGSNESKRIQKTLKDMSSETAYIELKSSATKDFRAIYADELLSKITKELLGGEEKFNQTLTEISKIMQCFIRFANVAITVYFDKKGTKFTRIN